MRSIQIALEKVDSKSSKNSDLKKQRQRIYDAKTPAAVTEAVAAWAAARDALHHPVLRILEDERASRERPYNPIPELEQNAINHLLGTISHEGNAAERIGIATRSLSQIDDDTPAGKKALNLIDRDLDIVQPLYARRTAARFLARHTKPGTEIHAHARRTISALADVPGPVRTFLQQARAKISFHK